MDRKDILVHEGAGDTSPWAGRTYQFMDRQEIIVQGKLLPKRHGIP